MFKKFIAFFSTALFLASALPALANEMPMTVKVKQMVNINASGQAMLSGTLKSMSATSLTVASWGGDWVINLTPTTSLLRRFDGHASLSEFAVGDNIQVKGKANTTGLWTIDARMVQDNSIQTSNAVFTGTISNVNGNTFTLTTSRRGTLQVTVKSDAKIMVGGVLGATISLTNGLMVSVSGVVNTQNMTLLANKVWVTQKEMDRERKNEENENK